jgi:hypothetical protein
MELPLPPPPERLLQPVPEPHRADPYPFYAELRRTDPVHRSGDGFWVLTRHAEVRAALRDPRLRRSADELGGASAPFRPEGPDWLERLEERAATRVGRAGILALSKLWMVNLDPPRHPPLRRAAAPGLAAAAVERLRPRLRALAEQVVAAVGARDRFDFVAEIAQPLPARVICELLGIAEEDRARTLGAARALGPALAGDGSDAAVDRAATATLELARFFRDQLARPAGPAPESFLARLAAALPEAHAVAQAILMLFAGQETTAGLIANGLLALAADPAARARLAGEPALAPHAVEELLRFDGPVQFTLRVAAEPVAFGGQRIERGDYLALGLAAANRDPAAFADPDRLDLAREPNPHLGFGLGAHSCLGAALARAEGEELFRALTRLRPGLRPEPGGVSWRPGSILRAPARFLVVDAAPQPARRATAIT